MSPDKQTVEGAHLSTENFKEPDPPLVIVQSYNLYTDPTNPRGGRERWRGPSKSAVVDF